MSCRVVGGDTCKIVTNIATDSETMVAAPVTVGVQGTLGASTVILPGVSIGAQATLAPLTVPTIGSSIKPKATYMGAPASAVKVSIYVALVGSTAYRLHS